MRSWKSLTLVFSLACQLSASELPIEIDGSSSVYPITSKAAEAFQEATGIPVNVEFRGTSAGFRRFLEGNLPILDASRPILKSEIDEAKRKGIEYIEIPFAFDALTIVVHPENDWANEITTSELKKLWEQSASPITHWNQIREGWPAHLIRLLGPGADSGTQDFFGEVIVGGKVNLRTDYLGSEDDEMLAKEIAGDIHSLGFLPHSYTVGNDWQLKALPVGWDIDARTGRNTLGKPSQPTRKNLVSGAYVPLSRPLFLYVNKELLDSDPRIERFLEYLLTDGRRFIHEVGYVTLNEQAYVQGLDQLEERATGTRFGGKIPASVPLHDVFTLEPVP